MTANATNGTVGLVLSDLDTAYLEAFRAATEIWIEGLLEMRSPRRARFEIRDVSGRVLLVLPFSEVIESGKAARRPLPSFAALTEVARRARSMQAEVTAQIEEAWSHIREAKGALTRLGAVIERVT